MRGRALLLTRFQQGANTKEIDHAARALFEQALAIDPNDANALADAAYTFYADYYFQWSTNATDYDAKVLGQVDQAIALVPDNVWAYWVKSFYLDGSNRPNEGLRAADEGLAINPNYAQLYNARGYAEINLGQYGQAKSDLLQAMRLSPRDPAIGLWQTSSSRRRTRPRPFRRRDRPNPPGDRCRLSHKLLLPGARGRLCARRQDGRGEDRFGGGPSFQSQTHRQIGRAHEPSAGRARRPAQGGAAGGVSRPLAGKLRTILAVSTRDSRVSAIPSLARPLRSGMSA